MNESQFDKAMRSYETIVVVSALLVGFALGLLPVVMSNEANSDNHAPPNFMLGLCRITLISGNKTNQLPTRGARCQQPSKHI
jgi:hypothetical protein